MALRAAHESFLAETPRRRRGDVDVETAVAAAKLNDAQTLEDARDWPNSRERLAILNDRALIAMLGSPAERGGPGERRVMPDSWSSPWRGVDGPWRGVGPGLNRRKHSVLRLFAVPRTCDLGGFVAMSARRDAFASGERARQVM